MIGKTICGVRIMVEASTRAAKRPYVRKFGRGESLSEEEFISQVFLRTGISRCVNTAEIGRAKNSLLRGIAVTLKATDPETGRKYTVEIIPELCTKADWKAGKGQKLYEIKMDEFGGTDLDIFSAVRRRRKRRARTYLPDRSDIPDGM